MVAPSRWKSVLCLLPLIAVPASGGQGTKGGSYELVWADEFERDGLPDPAKWVWDTHANKLGWYNKELQYYSADRPENARVEKGRLIITARKEILEDRADHGGQNYTSARLVTKGKAEWTYGMIEVRAKLPCGKGSWPAIWTLGSTAGHPDGGEIDIMEHVGMTPGDVFGTVHTRASVGTSGNGAKVRVDDACAAFHDYQLVWTPKELRFAVDGKAFHKYVNEGTGAAQWPFDNPQYLLLNLAVGGAMGGAVDDAIFPTTFEIEHVRVYQRKP